MKKFVSMLLISTMLVTALTACDNKTNESDSNPSSSSTATGNDSTGDSSSADNSSSDNESSTSEDSASTPDDSNSDTDLPSGETDEPVIDNSGLEFPDNKAGNIAKTILETNEWPKMDIVDDQDFLGALFSAEFNLDSCEEYCFASNVMSVQLNKIIVIKPKEGSEEEISNAIDAYLEAVQTDPNIAFYPMQQASAEGAVKGQTDDGYYYVIVHESGADIETGMLAAI